MGESLSPDISYTHRLLQLSEISLWIDTYDDIFSDFDSRPYSERSLSEDFLAEVNRASRDKPSGNFELKFLLPAAIRNLSHEHLIRRRLKEHFRKHYHRLAGEYRSVRRRGILLTSLGIFMLIGASYLAALEGTTAWFHLLMILLEPGGWFLGWTGLDELFYTLRSQKPSLSFYEKMIHAEIHFVSY